MSSGSRSSSAGADVSYLPPQQLSPSRGLRGGPPSVWKGAVAGFLGGLAGSAVKLAGEAIFPPRKQGQEAPPEVLAEKIAGHHLPDGERKLAAQGMHWSFGPLVGALYGALVEFEPKLTARNGMAFGLGVNALTHQGALPMLGLSAPPKQQLKQERWSEAATHAAYGFTTELVRRSIRGR